MKVTVINEKIEKIDYSKIQLLIGEVGSIVLTTGEHEVDVFSGVRLYPTPSRYSRYWSKDKFSIFKGVLSLCSPNDTEEKNNNNSNLNTK